MHANNHPDHDAGLVVVQDSLRDGTLVGEHAPERDLRW